MTTRTFAALATAAVVVCAVACSSSVVDRSGSGSTSDGGTNDAAADVTSTPPVPDGVSCANDKRDGDETDVDCGGATCPPCANAKACAAATDCVSHVCTNGVCTNDVGCSDGTREAFADPTKYPDVAACAGGWSIAGLATTTSPACARLSGNGSMNPKGTGCNVADLCQVGWHVCKTPGEVGVRAGATGCAGAVVAGQNAFFAIRQSGSGGAACGEGTNDIFGCGDVGAPADGATCAPIDRFSNDLCAALPPTWSCGANGADELNGVTKTASEGGGVLCCRD